MNTFVYCPLKYERLNTTVIEIVIMYVIVIDIVIKLVTISTASLFINMPKLAVTVV